MNMIFDKFIDGLFIFVGVYIAFWFDQYQEDQALKRELNLHMTEIIRDLPSEEPPSKIPPFKFAQTKKEDGTCGTPVYFSVQSQGRGRVNLDVIQKRGLARFIKDDKIIPFLSFYYDELIPQMKEKSDRFYDKLNDVVDKKLGGELNQCLTIKQIEQIETSVTSYYAKMHIAKGVAKLMGYKSLQEILAQGYKKPPVQSVDFNYNIEFMTEEEMKEQEKSSKSDEN